MPPNRHRRRAHASWWSGELLVVAARQAWTLSPSNMWNQWRLHCTRKLIGVGIWGDGAPCNWDRSDSIEVFSMLLPGLSEEWRNLRIPLTGLSKNMSSLLPPFMICVKCLHGALST